jgi:phosphoribosylformylglycinamidine cyclo-ligase
VKSKMSYKKAGVDIDKTDKMVRRIKTLCAGTTRPEVLGKIGNFSGFCTVPKKYKEPVLVSSTDGVGTKLIVSLLRNDFSTIGIDLVAMCVNDLITSGAEPLFFLDYYATGKVSPEHFFAVLKGIVRGCKQSNCALVGGEIAEMPDCYANGTYDLAGFSVGINEKSKIITGKNVKKGDVLIGLASSGLHSNGYSLARKVFTKKEISSSDWGKELLKPTRIYVKVISELVRSLEVRSIAHITGGGLYDNLPRVMPRSVAALIDQSAWKIPPLFQEIQKRGTITDSEMFRTFNMGIGMVVIVDTRVVDKALSIVRKNRQKAFIIGEVISGAREVKIA